MLKLEKGKIFRKIRIFYLRKCNVADNVVLATFMYLYILLNLCARYGRRVERDADAYKT